MQPRLSLQLDETGTGLQLRLHPVPAGCEHIEITTRDRPEADARASFGQESQDWTCLLSANPFTTETLRRAFRYDGPVLEAGYPLVDMLAGPDPDRDELASQLGLPAGHRFILYAPTWRDHRPAGHWEFDLDLQLDLDAISAALEPDQILLLRAHHLVAAWLDSGALPPNARDVSRVDDVSALCALAEVLVTDYSSVFFDFAVTGRPILFHCYDLEHYADQVRGFYLDVKRDLPGPVARTTQELIGMLRSLSDVQAGFASRYAVFRERFCPLADGSAARRVVDAFFRPASSVPPGRLDQVGVDYKWVELANGRKAVLLASPGDEATAQEAPCH